MKLDLRFTSRPLEELWCQTVTGLLFQGPISKSDELSGLDGKTSGYLTYLWDKGFWTASGGEMLLVASQEMIPADKILLKGLGNRSEYNLCHLTKRIDEVGRALEGKGVDDIGIRIPFIKDLESEFLLQLEAACMHLVDPFLMRHKDEDNFLLKINVSLGLAFIGRLESVICSLKKHFLPLLDYTIVIGKEKENLLKNEDASENQ